MSIKIIKNNMTEPFEITCYHCSSVFSYTYEDIQRAENYSMLGLAPVKRFVVCPVCKFDVDIRPIAKLKEARNG